MIRAIDAVGSEEFYEWHVSQDGRVRIRYTVREGDTLSEIAQRFGLPTASMARINQIGRSATLRVGQQLVVYTTPDRVPREGSESVVEAVAAAQAEVGVAREAVAETETEAAEMGTASAEPGAHGPGADEPDGVEPAPGG